jgi:predicted nucleotidyltransferase
MKYGLPDQTVNQICALLAQYPAVERAVLYGSRAKGNYKPGSDIDLTLHGSDLTPRLCATIAELKHPELEAHIQRIGVIFFERKSLSSLSHH